jgi:hypothetical protein
MLREENVQGHDALVRENELLRITVLPHKGADVYEFVHKQLGVSFLLKTPRGLRPPGDVAPKDFLDNYEGGWQELFPNTDSPWNYKGADLPFHGEVALLRWESEVQRDDLEETAVRLTVRCRETPFELQRLMRLPARESVLDIEETVINQSETSSEFVWGHHLVLGGNFLEEGCGVDIPAKTLNTREELYEPATACLAPGQREPWPHARRRERDQWMDLSYVPGAEVHTHDEIFITDLS